MKIFTITLILFSLPALLFARDQGGGTGQKGGQMGRQSNRGGMQGAMSAEVNHGAPHTGMSTLYQFLIMDDEALEQLEATIRRIRQMTPEERVAFQEKILEYQTMPSEDRQQIQQAWGRIDSKVRSAWREYMMGLDPDEREKVRQELQSVPPDSRTHWRIEVLKKAGLLESEASDDPE